MWNIPGVAGKILRYSDHKTDWKLPFMVVMNENYYYLRIFRLPTTTEYKIFLAGGVLRLRPHGGVEIDLLGSLSTRLRSLSAPWSPTAIPIEEILEGTRKVPWGFPHGGAARSPPLTRPRPPSGLPRPIGPGGDRLVVPGPFILAGAKRAASRSDPNTVRKVTAVRSLFGPAGVESDLFEAVTSKHPLPELQSTN